MGSTARREDGLRARGRGRDADGCSAGHCAEDCCAPASSAPARAIGAPSRPDCPPAVFGGGKNESTPRRLPVLVRPRSGLLATPQPWLRTAPALPRPGLTMPRRLGPSPPAWLAAARPRGCCDAPPGPAPPAARPGDDLPVVGIAPSRPHAPLGGGGARPGGSMASSSALHPRGCRAAPADASIAAARPGNDAPILGDAPSRRQCRPLRPFIGIGAARAPPRLPRLAHSRCSDGRRAGGRHADGRRSDGRCRTRRSRPPPPARASRRRWRRRRPGGRLGECSNLRPTPAVTEKTTLVELWQTSSRHFAHVSAALELPQTKTKGDWGDRPSSGGQRGGVLGAFPSRQSHPSHPRKSHSGGIITNIIPRHCARSRCYGAALVSVSHSDINLDLDLDLVLILASVLILVLVLV